MMRGFASAQAAYDRAEPDDTVPCDHCDEGTVVAYDDQGGAFDARCGVCRGRGRVDATEGTAARPGRHARERRRSDDMSSEETQVTRADLEETAMNPEAARRVTLTHRVNGAAANLEHARARVQRAESELGTARTEYAKGDLESLRDWLRSVRDELGARGAA